MNTRTSPACPSDLPQTHQAIPAITRLAGLALDLLLVIAIGGCAAALPAQDADFGDPRPLMNLVMSGQVEPNTPLPARSDGSVTLTPLCALLGYLTAGPAIDVLLSKGADVNKPCRTISGNDAYLAAIAYTPNLPLDIVALAAVDRGTIPSPYTANPRYRPQDLPALYASADMLIQRGARSKTGPMSLEQIKQRVNSGIDAGNQNVAEQKERLAERNKNSILNAETLGAVVAIAGATASNYAAQSNQRNIQATGAALPLAQLRPTPSSTKVTAAAPANVSLPGVTPRIAETRVPATPTYSGAACGPNIRCTLGMSGQRWCEPTIAPTGAACQEGCEIRGWGAAYHDTSLPSNVANIPTGKACAVACTVLNQCGG